MKQCNADLVSIIILTYNQEEFIEETVDAALSQDYSPLEIIIADDHSDDATLKRVRCRLQEYEGGHTIKVVQSDVNRGVNGNLNNALNYIDGSIIIACGGDDVCASERASEVVKAFSNYQCSAVYSSAMLINERGEDIGTWRLKRRPNVVECINSNDIFSTPVFYGAGAAYKKGVYDDFGPLPSSVRNEDLLMATRAACMSGSVYIDKPLFKYRKHSSNLSFWIKIKNEPSVIGRTVLRIQSYLNFVRNLELILEMFRERYGVDSKIYKTCERERRETIELINILSNVIGMRGLPGNLKQDTNFFTVIRILKKYIQKFFWRTVRRVIE